MGPVSRRGLLRASGAAAGVVLAGACSSEPRDDVQAASGRRPSSAPPPQPLAAVADLSTVPTPTVDPVTGDGAFLVRSGRGVVMLSAICTHMGCAVEWESGQDEFVCPCHGATYDPSGEVVSGPAPQRLARLPVTVRHGQVYRR